MHIQRIEMSIPRKTGAASMGRDKVVVSSGEVGLV